MPDKHDEHGSKGHRKKGGHGHGPGGHEEHEEGVPEWVVSFADNALLQMGFFVILLAMNLKEPTTGGVGGKDDFGNQPQSEAMLDFMISIREAFNNPVNPNSNDPRESALVRRVMQRKEGTAKQEGPPGDKPDVQAVRPTDYHRIGGLINFEENDDAVDAAGLRTAAELARQLKGRRTVVEIRGHTSTAEAADPQDKGMRLSYSRAMAVAQVLRTGGLEWEQLRIVACGAGNRATPIARSVAEARQNQRVEIVVTDEQLPPDPYAVDQSGPRDAN
jgi:outer membrane protein OmpA-like peptidoglycan-associated protein